MDAWKAEGVNWYTANHLEWAKILSLSTQDWNLAPFPDHVFAIPGTLDNSTLKNSLPSDAKFVVQNAGMQSLGSSKIEQIIFATTTVIVCGVGLAWAIYHAKRGTLRRPKVSSSPSRPGSRQSGRTAYTAVTVEEDGFLTHESFKDQLRHYYYGGIETELEPGEKDVTTESVSGEDVERLTELLRQMYGLDLQRWATGSYSDAHAGEMQHIGMKSDAILEEVRRILASWERKGNAAMGGWGGEEKKAFERIQEILRGIPQKRHS
jgi:hypothetical protein